MTVMQTFYYAIISGLKNIIFLIYKNYAHDYANKY